MSTIVGGHYQHTLWRVSAGRPDAYTEIEPAPAQNFDIGKVCLPELVDAGGLVFELIHCPAGHCKAMSREGAALMTMKAGLVIRSWALSVR